MEKVFTKAGLQFDKDIQKEMTQEEEFVGKYLALCNDYGYLGILDANTPSYWYFDENKYLLIKQLGDDRKPNGYFKLVEKEETNNG